MKGFELKRLRKQRRITREHLGSELGISVHTIAKWEQEKNPVPLYVDRYFLSQTRFEFTVEEFRQLQQIADERKCSIEAVIVGFVRARLNPVT